LEITGLKTTIKAIWTLSVTNPLEYTQDEKIEEMKQILPTLLDNFWTWIILDNFEYWILEYGFSFLICLFLFKLLIFLFCSWGKVCFIFYLPYFFLFVDTVLFCRTVFVGRWVAMVLTSSSCNLGIDNFR
jgi:hypothetical protein